MIIRPAARSRRDRLDLFAAVAYRSTTAPEDTGMRRRCVLAAAASLLAAPQVARGQATRVLRFIARGDPGSLDPVAEPRPEVADAALLVWDTLYGVNSRLEPQAQLCAGHECSDDRRTWTFRLRPGLRFHDAAPVLARDAVASLHRWMPRDRLGSAIRDRLDALEVVDDLTFRFRLRAAFGPLLYALGKPDPPLAVVMPERLALAGPTVAVTEIIGCGPMRLRPGQSQPGRLVFERFAEYQARGEAGDWLAGGKRLLFERIEWICPGDPARATEALQGGEADWWAAPTADQVPVLKRNRNLLVDIADPLGRIGLLRLARQRPPFDDVRVRRAVLLAISQDACMAVQTGGDDALWRPMASVFTPGTPAAAQAAATQAGAGGASMLPVAADVDAGRRLVAEAGSVGLPAVVVPQAGAPSAKAEAATMVTLLQRLGLAAELRLEADDWNALATSIDGAAAATPANPALDDAGEGPVADARAAWYAAATPEQVAAAVAAMHRAALASVAFVPTGLFLRYQSWRTSLSGVVAAPFPVFWGPQKT